MAGVLQRFQVNARMAHTALENDAKKEMKEVSMSILEEFANAIRTRNLEYFADMNNEKKLKKLKAGLLLLSRDREVVYSFHETFDLVDELIEIVDEMLEKD